MALAPPPLATTVRRGFQFSGLLRWWHLLSLDAPTVAALWSWTLARAVHIRLPWSAPLLLAMGTWLVYVADRILDGLHGNASGQLRERHFFYARHRSSVLTAAMFAGLALLWLIFTQMNPAARREDVVLFTAALIYFCLIHVWAPHSQRSIERWFPKEMAVAIVFAAAVAVPAWSRSGNNGIGLPAAVALFALLCWLNCVAIEKWEKGENRQHPTGFPDVSAAAQPHLTTRWTQNHLRLLSCGIAVLAAIAAMSSLVTAEPLAMTGLYFAGTISALLFLAFDCLPLGVLDLRIAADVALLTPILLLPVLR